MVRFKVCRLSELINTCVIALINILFFIIIFRCTNIISKNINFDIAEFMVRNVLIYGDDNSINRIDTSTFDRIILSQLVIKDVTTENDDIASKKNNNIVYENNIVSNDVLDAQKISETKVQVGSVRIENYTKDELNLDELSKSMQIGVSKKEKVLIYHTHTSEGYANSSSYRSDDTKNNVVAVGKQLVDELSKYNFKVTHDTTVHDKESFNHAYTASLETINKRLKNDDYNIFIDIHRDALSANSAFRPTAEINGETVAKLMFVIGTDYAGLEHDEWMKNLEFAIAFQERANEMYPGLFRDIHLSTSRYNQHVSNKAVIVEVGATGNTLEEAKGAMKYFAEILNTMT